MRRGYKPSPRRRPHVAPCCRITSEGIHVSAVASCRSRNTSRFDILSHTETWDPFSQCCISPHAIMPQHIPKDLRCKFWGIPQTIRWKWGNRSLSHREFPISLMQMNTPSNRAQTQEKTTSYFFSKRIGLQWSRIVSNFTSLSDICLGEKTDDCQATWRGSLSKQKQLLPSLSPLGGIHFHFSTALPTIVLTMAHCLVYSPKSDFQAWIQWNQCWRKTRKWFPVTAQMLHFVRF